MKRPYLQCLAVLLIFFTTASSAMADLTVKDGEDLLRSASKGSAQALRALQKAAQDGDIVGQTKLGDYYNIGVGQTAKHQDYTKAYKWYRKAADRDYPEAEFKLGTLYVYGHGVPVDIHEAMKWYRKAYARNYPEAAYNMGLLYKRGGQIPRDYVEAAKWYLKAIIAQFLEWVSYFWLVAVIVMTASIIFARITRSKRFLELVAGLVTKFVRDVGGNKSIKVSEPLVRILAVIVFARIFSYCFYWAPFWLEGGIHDQASSWAPMAIDIWTVSGLLGGLITVAATKSKRSNDQPVSE